MMRTMTILGAAVALGAGGLALAAPPAFFAKSQPGLWELSGMEGSRGPARMCLADLSELAQIEHRGRGCKLKPIRESAASITLSYECSAKDFGRSEVYFVTPRNFRIVSQGIAGGLPFAHTVQARRVGDCEPKAAPAGH